MGWDAGGGRGGGGRRLDGGGKSVKVPQITSIEVPSDGQMMVPDWSNYQVSLDRYVWMTSSDSDLPQSPFAITAIIPFLPSQIHEQFLSI